MEWYEPDVQALEHDRTRRKLPCDAAVFYGSSSIRLWDTLAEDLGDARVINLGFGGSTLEACVWFFERLVPPVRPASLVVYAGDNDVGDGRRPREVVESFTQLIGKMEHPAPDVVRLHLHQAQSGARCRPNNATAPCEWLIESSCLPFLASIAPESSVTSRTLPRWS